MCAGGLGTGARVGILNPAKFAPTRSRWGNGRGVLPRPQRNILSTCLQQRRLPLVPNAERQMAQALPSTVGMVRGQMYWAF